MRLPFFFALAAQTGHSDRGKLTSRTTLPAGAKSEHKNSGYAVVPRIASFLACHADCH